MRRKMKCILIICILASTILTGCWDRVEIDQRGFVTEVMVDAAPPGYAEEVAESVKGIPGMEKQTGTMMKVTYTFPNTSLLASEGGSGGESKGFVTMSSVATSIAKANRYIDSRMNRRLFFGHTQVIVFGEDFLKDSEMVKKVLDYFSRDPQFARTMKVLVTKGEASKLGEVKPKTEKMIFRYIRGIIENEVTNGRIIDLNFNEFVSKLSNSGGTGILPRISIEGDEAKISGVGLIKDFKLVGFLSEYDSLYFNALQGKRRGGRETINVGDMTVDFATNNAQRKVKLLNKDPKNLEIGITVRIEGTLVAGEFNEELYDSEVLEKIEKELNKMAEDSSKFVIDKLQKEYGVDALKIDEYLQKFYPSIWEEIKDKWDEVYPTIKIIPRMDYKIRRIGDVK